MPEIEKHLHQLSHLIREQDSIKLVVRLESAVGSRIRYLAVVSCSEQEAEEFCLLGIDCDHNISLGLVLAILSYTTIRLDGDGGFCVTTGDGLRSHIFKPVSVQTMWSALQSLYRASECAKENNSFQASAVRYYEDVFSSHKSDPSCLNEWNILPGVENRRPLTSAFTTEELSFQDKISCTLRDILECERDLDEVTSKEIRTKLENRLQIDLSNYKSFIDEEMLKILGQMEAPALILDHLYLGTEWNASHLQDLFDKEINHILNVTTEIDNFFPDTFRYMNIPVCDTEDTDILRYFNDSYRFINKARKDGKNVLVHCKMGISRSATIVIAYVMKTRNWDLSKTLKHVKERRNCVKPNPNFMKQLEIYEGILTAKRFSTTLEKRSKSESNLKQSDKSILVTHNDRVLCSSNSDITDHGIDVKTHKKYFNTAPARLKPEKSGRLLGDILKPKSSSCTEVCMVGSIQSSDSTTELHEIVPQEIMSSFEEAVNILEYTPQTPTEMFFSGQETSRRKSTISLEIPIVTITDDSSSNCGSGNFTDPKVQSPVPDDDAEKKLNCENNFETLTEDDANSLPPTLANDSIIMDNEDPMSTEPHCEESNKKAMSLKCCRRPYNGHTFSVSPNQVVNITSVVDYSKFSVRHLVNEFELQSNRFNQGSGSSCESTSTNSAVELSSHNKSIRTKGGAKKSKELLERCESDYSSEDQESGSMPHLPEVDEIKTPLQFFKPPKKSEKLGCLPFFRKYSSSSSKSSQNKNAVGPSGHIKKTSGDRSRERPKDKGGRGKILETVAKLSENGDSISPLENLPVKYQSTGVVKQRREVFESISVPHSKHHQLFFRSHNRSHSATGPSGSFQFDTMDHLSQRKSSMPSLSHPHLDIGGRNSEFDVSPFSQRHPHIQIQVSDRKASLDSNGSLFKSFPCPMVRGFQNSGGSSRQHGSTHPLNLLPRTPTLT